MQPPPRKVKESQEVKVTFSEQVAWLQTKHQLANDLLEDIRSFSKQRAAIEKEYGQALQRLALQYQKKDWHRVKGDALTSGGVFAVWRSLVEATARSAAARLSAADGYRSLTAEAMKNLRAAKDQRAKRAFEQLQRVQGELVEAVRDLNKVKKRYWQLEHITNVAKEKAADAQARSKKGDHGLFHFRTGMQKMTAKLNARLAECDQRLTEARNDYLLTLSAINAHQQHYRFVNLPAIMENIDGDLYDHLRAQFTLLCHTEMDVCQLVQSEFVQIQNDASQVTREQDLQIFLRETPAFTHSSEFLFQAASSDKVCSLQHLNVAQNGESWLLKEARKWAAKAAKDYKVIAHGERALQTLERRCTMATAEEAGVGLERKMEEVKESVRKARVSQVRAESRLALLAEAGVDVDTWMKSAMSQAAEELETERRLSEARISNGDVSAEDDDFEFTDFEDFEENGDAFAESTARPLPYRYPFPCRVLYSYKACQADELSITEGEELQVIEDGDMEDWLKARKATGQEGYVPERYLQFLQWPAEGEAHSQVPESTELRSFSSSASSLGAHRIETEQSSCCTGVVRALYEYQGQSAEELSFPEGALIRLRRCCHSLVDDGFWEGELDGCVGVFPSLVVELLGEAEEEAQGEEFLGTPSPPSFSLPAVTGSPFGQHYPSSGPGSWPEHSTPPKDPEDRLQVVPQDFPRLLESRADSSSIHSSPDLSTRRIWPARAPPPPPSHKQPPVP